MTIPSPPVKLSVILTGFQLGYLSIAAAIVEASLIATYLLGVKNLRSKGRRWPLLRSASFVSGVVVVFIATGSGVAAYDDSVFTIHVIQHILLMNVAPILIALSAPMTLLLQASRKSVQTTAIKILHSGFISVVTFPVFAWVLAWGTMYAYFLTPLYQLSIEHPLFHDYTHLHFLVSGLIFWTALIGVDPIRWKMSYGAKLGYLLAGIPFGSFLGIALMSVRVSISPAHTVADIHAGGAILWVFDEVLTVAAIAIIFFQWANHEERKALRADREFDRKLASSEAGEAN